MIVLKLANYTRQDLDTLRSAMGTALSDIQFSYCAASRCETCPAAHPCKDLSEACQFLYEIAFTGDFNSRGKLKTPAQP